jgi:sulfur-oxidizing protein SoxZ
MARLTKMKIKKAGDKHQVLVLVNHPMETGRRKDSKTGQLVPAHFIKSMEFKHNGKVVAEANLASGVSKNPLIGIEILNAKAGDKVEVSWSDNKGDNGSAQSAVK